MSTLNLDALLRDTMVQVLADWMPKGMDKELMYTETVRRLTTGKWRETTPAGYIVALDNDQWRMLLTGDQLTLLGILWDVNKPLTTVNLTAAQVLAKLNGATA